MDLIFEYLPAEQDGQLIGARPFLQRQIVVGQAEAGRAV